MLDETKFIGMAGLMAAEVLKEDTDAREAVYNLGDQVEVLPLTELPEIPVEHIWNNNPEILRVEFEPMPRLTFLSLYFGRKVTNNWLRLHGEVMVRRKGGVR